METEVLLQWNGEDPIVARLEGGGAKVLFKPGDIHPAEQKKAKHLAGAYRHFAIVEAEELKPKRKPKRPVTKKVEPEFGDPQFAEKEEAKEESK